MRRLALLLLVGFICLAAGFYAGTEMCQRGRTASAQAALHRASEALTVGRRDEALQYAFAAIDRNPDLYAAYEVAGDAVAAQKHHELAGHFYRAALLGISQDGRLRVQAKLAALSADP
jgi:Tfp pilus assembly protein PilF